ncbi:MAG: ATPase, T2SS/T4P/T4SS family [Thermodesulfobacteriota bacterium]|nr:ATPase, T2SS/T4P/T4SS family [Thermodesulfobacteriota bacterium]
MKRYKDQGSPENICRILVHSGLISRERADDLLKRQKNLKKAMEKKKAEKQSRQTSKKRIETSVTFMDVIIALKLKREDVPLKKLDEDTLYQALAVGWGFAYKKIDPLELELNFVTKIIPRTFAMKHLLLPLEMDSGRLVVATPNPFNHEALDDVQRVSNFKVKPIVSSKTDILKLIDEFFGFRQSITAAEDQFSGASVDLGNLEQYVRLKSADELPATDQHIVNAVNHIFSYSFDQKASDIHIEPKRETSLVRIRIDGVLHTVFKLPKKVHNAVISRIKTLSRLDMAEKRRPQDGRIKTEKEGVEVEIRVSSIPVAFGEKIVMRIMDPEVLLQDLDMLGFFKDDLVKYKKLIAMPHGIILVTGPTGSGKSTTLYSTLRMLSSSEVNITTIEEPIEMIHEDFNQIAVQPAIDVTFDSILKNILRQDPDIIMVGEIRDLQTAQSAVQAALTGHLVLSTLHTNDAVSSVIRLLDLGVPSFLVHSSLVGVVAQRLVRTICPHCVTDFEMDAAELKLMGLNLEQQGLVKLKCGKGCPKCRNTGYKGRKAVFEVLPYSESLKKMTSDDVNASALRKRAIMEGLTSLRDSAVKKMLRGETTYQEVLRVTWE